MTLEGLDEALRVLNLDIDCEEGMAIRNRILRKFGAHLLENKEGVCQKCWMKDNMGCSNDCQMFDLPNDTLEAAIKYLNSNNDINRTAFVCMFVVPVYEEVSGKTGTMEELYKIFGRLWKKKYGKTEKNSEY